MQQQQHGMHACVWKGAVRLQGHHRHVVRLRVPFPSLQDVVRAGGASWGSIELHGCAARVGCSHRAVLSQDMQL